VQEFLVLFKQELHDLAFFELPSLIEWTAILWEIDLAQVWLLLERVTLFDYSLVAIRVTHEDSTLKIAHAENLLTLIMRQLAAAAAHEKARVTIEVVLRRDFWEALFKLLLVEGLFVHILERAHELLIELAVTLVADLRVRADIVFLAVAMRCVKFVCLFVADTRLGFILLPEAARFVLGMHAAAYGNIFLLHRTDIVDGSFKCLTCDISIKEVG